MKYLFVINSHNQRKKFKILQWNSQVVSFWGNPVPLRKHKTHYIMTIHNLRREFAKFMYPQTCTYIICPIFENLKHKTVITSQWLTDAM